MHKGQRTSPGQYRNCQPSDDLGKSGIVVRFVSFEFVVRKDSGRCRSHRGYRLTACRRSVLGKDSRAAGGGVTQHLGMDLVAQPVRGDVVPDLVRQDGLKRIVPSTLIRIKLLPFTTWWSPLTAPLPPEKKSIAVSG